MVKHEPQVLSLGSDRRAVGGSAPAAPGRQTGRPTAQRGSARGPECAAVPASDRLPLAAFAARTGAVGDGLGVLSAVARRRVVGATARRTADPSPPGGPARSPAERREHRQPVGQDGGKGGGCGYDAGKKIKGRKRHLVVDTLGL